MTQRTTLVLMLLGLLSVATAAASPAAAAGFDALSCPTTSTVSAAADAPLSWLPEPQPATGCTFRVNCPNGGVVQCSDPNFGECSYWYTCHPILQKCGVECLSTTKYCPGYNASNCAC